jgi:hypothetical protein
MIAFSRLSLLVLFLGTLAAATPLGAQDMPEKPTVPAAPEPVPLPPPPTKAVPLDIPMEAYGTANPECLEWTDSCRTCVRDEENRVSCSTPGIACLSQDISCKTKRK